MLDPKQLRQNLQIIAAQLARRGYVFDTATFSNLEAKRHDLQLKTQNLQTQRNQISKAVGLAKSRGEEAAPLREKVAHLGDELREQENQLEMVQQQLLDFQLQLPNILHDSVPDGTSENEKSGSKTLGKTTKV